MRFFFLTIFAILVGCGDEINNGFEILANITEEEIKTGAPNWKRMPELDFTLDLDSIDFDKYNTHFTIGYNHRRWGTYIKPALWSGTYSRGDFLYISDGHGVNIYKFDLNGNFIERVATRPALSNRKPEVSARLIEENKTRKPITDGISRLVVNPDETRIDALIVWSPRDYSRPHYVNLVKWHNGELLHGASGFGLGNAYNHWEPVSDNGKPDPPWNNAKFRLGYMLYLGDTLSFYKDDEFWNTNDETVLTLDVIPEKQGHIFLTDNHIYIGDCAHQVFTYEGKLVGSLDLESIVSDDGVRNCNIRVPFYNLKHKTLYALSVDYTSDVSTFYAFKPY